MSAGASNILYAHSDPITIINAEMPRINEYFQSNNLHINRHKTVAMFFYARQRFLKLDDNLVLINGDIILFLHIQSFWVLSLTII